MLMLKMMVLLMLVMLMMLMQAAHGVLRHVRQVPGTAGQHAVQQLHWQQRQHQALKLMLSPAPSHPLSMVLQPLVAGVRTAPALAALLWPALQRARCPVEVSRAAGMADRGWPSLPSLAQRATGKLVTCR